jgi:asparagine synthase (glutamine-hydrolysing)
MSDRMLHRGPDDEGSYLDQTSGVALGVRRLSIIDVSGGHQPISTPDGMVWAVMNGEIYNHPALMQTLERSGHRFSTRTDTEVLVHLYEEYGDALTHALDGMYAFAIYDARRRRLLLARDRFGEKPLFYAAGGGHLVFASELNALECGVDEAWQIDAPSLAEYLQLGYIRQPRSLVREVVQLPPAHVLTWDADSRNVSVRSYWKAVPGMWELGRSDADLIDETERLLRASVRSRLVSEVPLGVLLSGGLDSTLVATLAAQESSAAVRTFTIGYDIGSVNETAQARRVADHLRTDHTEVTLASSDVARRVPQILARLDQPVADQALIALHFVAKVARQSVTVAIGGEGADELFGGYPKYKWVLRAERMHRYVPRSVLDRLASVPIVAEATGRRRHFRDLLVEESPQRRSLDWMRPEPASLWAGLLGPRLAAHMQLQTVADDVDVSGNDNPDLASALMRFDQRHWLVDDVLAKADRASMLVSLEMRTPYLARDVAEFATAVPASVHLKHRGKFLLRSCLERHVPESARPVRKTAFRVPAGDWLRGPLSSELRRITAGRLTGDGWINQPALQCLIEDHIDGRSDGTHRLWRLLVLGSWLEAHPDVA